MAKATATIASERQAKGFARYLTGSDLESLSRAYRRNERVIRTAKGNVITRGAIEAVFAYLGKSQMLEKGYDA